MILIIILFGTVLSHDSNVPILTEEDYDKLRILDYNIYSLKCE